MQAISKTSWTKHLQPDDFIHVQLSNDMNCIRNNQDIIEVPESRNGYCKTRVMPYWMGQHIYEPVISKNGIVCFIIEFRPRKDFIGLRVVKAEETHIVTKQVIGDITEYITYRASVAAAGNSFVDYCKVPFDLPYTRVYFKADPSTGTQLLCSDLPPALQRVIPASETTLSPKSDGTVQTV